MYLLFPALIYIYNVGHFLLIILLLKKIIYKSYYFITSSLALYLNVSLPFFYALTTMSHPMHIYQWHKQR